jgi:hypothetical protein
MPAGRNPVPDDSCCGDGWAARTWRVADLDQSGPNTHLYGISCPTAGLCAVAANDGQIFTSTDPFSADATPKRSADGRKRRRRPKRPRVTIATGPPPAIELPGRRLTVRFRFFARHRVQVRGFLCRLDGHPLRRCRSPKSYRVGFGRHIFRVRAIGWSGRRGPVARWPFRICHPTPHVGCLRHLPSPGPAD